jgi:hypothetical protein
VEVGIFGSHTLSRPSFYGNLAQALVNLERLEKGEVILGPQNKPHAAGDSYLLKMTMPDVPVSNSSKTHSQRRATALKIVDRQGYQSSRPGSFPGILHAMLDP